MSRSGSRSITPARYHASRCWTASRSANTCPGSPPNSPLTGGIGSSTLSQILPSGYRLRPPLLVLWSQRDDLEDLYGDPLAIWREWASDVRGHGIDSGHHIAEEAPDALAASLGDFFSSR
jgi:hypothetical protein